MAPPNDGQSRCSKIYRATAVFILLKIDKIPGFRGLLILGHDANLCPPTRRKTRMGLQAGPIQAFVHFILYCSLCYWRQMETAPRAYCQMRPQKIDLEFFLKVPDTTTRSDLAWPVQGRLSFPVTSNMARCLFSKSPSVEPRPFLQVIVNDVEVSIQNRHGYTTQHPQS